PDLDPELEAVLLKALAKDCAARYQSSREFADALRWWLRGAAAPTTLAVGAAVRSLPAAGATLPVTASTLTGATPLRRRRGLWLNIVLAVLAGIAGLLLAFGIERQFVQPNKYYFLLAYGAGLSLAGLVVWLLVRAA